MTAASSALNIRTRKCRYCGATILDDETGAWHELVCGREKSATEQKKS